MCGGGGGGGGGGIGGVISSIGDTAKNVVQNPGAALAGGIFGPVGSIIGANNAASGQNQDSMPNAPGQDPQLSAALDAQRQQAQEFRSGLPDMQNQLNERAVQTQRQSLGQDLVQSKRNANQRGLLYSGIKEGNDINARIKNSGQLAEAKSSIANSLNTQANSLDQAATQGQLNAMQTKQQLEDSVYRTALQNIALRNSALTSLGSGLGKMGGMIAAGG